MSVTLDLQIGDRNLDLQLELDTGETIAVLGPNGAGKSTLLTVIAGLLKPDTGRGTLDGDTLFDLPTHRRDRSVWLPPHRRGVSLLAQDALLFPHLTAAENVAFGPRSTGASPAEARNAAAHWLAEVDARELADRRPTELSGGQAQRVAVARALASNPRLLLLDEPMAALDVSVAPAIRRLLRRVLTEQTTIIVTHDILDAYLLADRVIIIENGHITDTGTPAEVFDHPRSPFTAGLAGVNLIPGTRRGDSITVTDGQALPIAPGTELAENLPALFFLHPTAVTVAPSRPVSAGRAAIIGTVTDIEPRGHVVRIRTALLAADVPPRVAAELDAEIGSALWFSYDPDAADAYPAHRSEDAPT